MSKKLLEKLERYEQDAYDGKFGCDWLESVGEGFKFYVQKCVHENKCPTIKGFEQYLDDMHKKANRIN